RGRERRTDQDGLGVALRQGREVQPSAGDRVRARRQRALPRKGGVQVVTLQGPEVSRSTKVVATLGPASSSPEIVLKLIEAGVNVFRLNFSHGKREDHRNVVNIIRQTADHIGACVGILQDLQGPKIRVGVFAEGAVELEEGQ